MAGRGEMAEEDTAVIDGVFILDDSSRIVPARAPLNIYSSVRKKAGMQGINPGFSFSRKIHEATGRKILLVVNARGGTTLGQWQKGAEPICFDASFGDEPEKYGKTVSLYDEAVTRCREAMRHGALKAVLWHQGEGNVADPKSYMKQLPLFVRHIRDDLGVSADVPFIAGEIYEGFNNADAFNASLDRIGEVVENGYCVSSDGCKAKSDGVHFTREGQLLLGERYAEAVMNIVYHK